MKRKNESVKLDSYVYKNGSLIFENLIAPEYITTLQASHLLGISENALRIRVCRGLVPAYKHGHRLRFKSSEILNLFTTKES